MRCASLDGDADRVVFFYQDESNHLLCPPKLSGLAADLIFEERAFKLLDGDKISALAASFIIGLKNDLGYDIEIGVVQTAYANGASTRYFEGIVCSNFLYQSRWIKKKKNTIYM